MIYTGYWAKTDKYIANGLTPVGISGWNPDGYNGATYKKLAPRYSWWSEWHEKHLGDDWYIQKYYETVLNTLDPVTVVTELQQFGKDVVLLCFETPEKFCHRHIVANWLERTAKIPVREYILQPRQTHLL